MPQTITLKSVTQSVENRKASRLPSDVKTKSKSNRHNPPNHKPKTLPNDAVVCQCGFVIFDGEVIRSRAVKPKQGLALCRCKRWVQVPILSI